LTPGSRYEDFTPGMDKVAAYGIGGLVAGTEVAETGFLVSTLIFLNKFWVLVLVGFAGLVAIPWLTRKKPT
jgi:uncharacterized membrane-anchored protein